MTDRQVRDARDAFPGSSHSHTHGSYTGAASLASLTPHNMALTRTNTTKTAGEQLTRALLDLAARGQRPRCGDPETHHLWTSEDQADRDHAAQLCDGCPILTACAEAGQDETFGVWGGTDSSPSKRRPPSHVSPPMWRTPLLSPALSPEVFPR